MKLVTYEIPGQNVPHVGVVVDGQVVPAAGLLAGAGEDPAGASSMVRFIRLPRDRQKAVGLAARDAAAAGRGIPLDTVRLLAPVPRPSKIIGLGYNYRALCEHERVKPGKEPEIFAKLPTSVTGPHDPVVVPPAIDKVDFEAELGVVIGRVCRDVTPAEALMYVAGYTVVNDVTAKIIPRPPEAGSVVLALKGADTFCPFGPALVTADEVPDPQNLQILCRVNGKEKQSFNTSDMVHSVAATIAYISARITLEPGDLITTGTSLGIGIIEKPPVFLDDNDVVECEIPGFGAIRNTFHLLAARR